MVGSPKKKKKKIEDRLLAGVKSIDGGSGLRADGGEMTRIGR
jgi:hypothetical protein